MGSIKGVKFELATIYDDISKTLNDANKDYFTALELKNKCSDLCQKSINKNRELLKEILKAEGIIKQLGIDSELKKVVDAKNKVENAIDVIDKSLNNFLSI